MGSTIFGLGWGASGICPGPAILNVVGAPSPAIFTFMAAMLAGMAAAERLPALPPARTPAAPPAPPPADIVEVPVSALEAG